MQVLNEGPSGGVGGWRSGGGVGGQRSGGGGRAASRAFRGSTLQQRRHFERGKVRRGFEEVYVSFFVYVSPPVSGGIGCDVCVF